MPGPPAMGYGGDKDKGKVDPGVTNHPEGLPPIDSQRAGETSRERDVNRRAPGGMPTPGRPSTPTPMAGSTFQPGTEGGAGGVMPFNPMRGPSAASMVSSRGALFGSQGGLQGGGLGVPLDPTSNSQSDPISTLISQLMKMRG